MVYTKQDLEKIKSIEETMESFYKENFIPKILDEIGISSYGRIMNDKPLEARDLQQLLRALKLFILKMNQNFWYEIGATAIICSTNTLVGYIEICKNPNLLSKSESPFLPPENQSIYILKEDPNYYNPRKIMIHLLIDSSLVNADGQKMENFLKDICFNIMKIQYITDSLNSFKNDSTVYNKFSHITKDNMMSHKFQKYADKNFIRLSGYLNPSSEQVNLEDFSDGEVKIPREYQYDFKLERICESSSTRIIRNTLVGPQSLVDMILTKYKNLILYGALTDYKAIQPFQIVDLIHKKLTTFIIIEQSVARFIQKNDDDSIRSTLDNRIDYALLKEKLNSDSISYTNIKKKEGHFVYCVPHIAIHVNTIDIPF